MDRYLRARKYIAIVIILLFVGTCIIPGIAQDIKKPFLPTSKGWMKTFGGGDSDSAYSVRQTSDGGYIVVGSTFSFGAGQADFWVIKTDIKGNMVWNQTFGGPDWDVASDVKQTNDNGYLITGRTHSFGAGNIDVWVIKLDETGHVQWNKTFGTQYFEGGVESQQTTDGGYIIIGSKGLYQFSHYDAWLIKIDKDGNELWNRTYGGPSEDSGHSVRQTNDGGYIIAGSTSSYGTFNNSTAAGWLIKIDEQGTMQWNKTYGGTEYDLALSVELTSDSGYVMVGYKFDLDSRQSDIWLIKTDQFGDEQWNKTYGGTLDDYGTQQYQTRDGGYIVIGWTSSYGAGAEDAWMIKTDASGNEQWNRTYGGKSYDVAYAFNQTSDGGYIITGDTASFGKDVYHGDLWLIKTDSQGKAKAASENQVVVNTQISDICDTSLFRHVHKIYFLGKIHNLTYNETENDWNFEYNNLRIFEYYREGLRYWGISYRHHGNVIGSYGIGGKGIVFRGILTPTFICGCFYSTWP